MSAGSIRDWTGDWAGVGSQCVRFCDAFSAVDWDQVDMDVEDDAAALDKNLRADDKRAEFERQDGFAVCTSPAPHTLHAHRRHHADQRCHSFRGASRALRSHPAGACPSVRLFCSVLSCPVMFCTIGWHQGLRMYCDKISRGM